MHARTFERVSGLKQRRYCSTQARRAGGQLRSVGGHSILDRARAIFRHYRKFASERIVRRRSIASARVAGVCCNKWFMTGRPHADKGQSLCPGSAAWTHAGRPPKKKSIDLRRQQSVHMHDRLQSPTD